MFDRLMVAGALAAGLAFAAPVQARDERRDTREAMGMTKGEERLAKMLEGRVAGEPQTCIHDFQSRGTTIIDRTALVFKVGDTLWVNRTRNPDAIDDDDRLVIRKFNATRTCRYEPVTTQQRQTGFYTGNLFLTDFVPYRRVDD